MKKIPTITSNQLVAIIGKEEADKMFLNKDWIRKHITNKSDYPLYREYKIYIGFYSKTTDDGKGNFIGNIYLEEKNLTDLNKDLPEKIKTLKGNLYLTFNQLTSLEGCPEEVYGDFYCDENQLTSLKGMPKKVTGNVNCTNNLLTSLDEIAEQIDGKLYSGSNDFGEEYYIYRDELTYKLEKI